MFIRNLITVSRQPLFPDSTKEAVDLAEMMDGGGHSKQRRENFAKTAQSKFFFAIQYMHFHFVLQINIPEGNLRYLMGHLAS